MHRSTMFSAALAATALLGAPAAALADATVVAGPLKAKGYSITLTATDGKSSDGFGVVAVKSAGGSQQLHSWTFSGVSVTVKGGSASIKGKLGRFGKVDARLRAGGKVKGIVPAGCKGSAGSARKGTLTGKTKLVLDSTFFRTIAPKALKAQILQAGKLDCTGGKDPSTPSGGLMLMSTADREDGQLMVNLSRAGGKVTQTVMRTDAPSAPASVLHMISARTGAAGLEAAGDLSTATARAAGPFLSGTLSFAGEGMGTMATGAATGDFTAKFDSIGAQSLPQGNDAMLMQR
jgi:hypothetical protein